MDGDCQFNGGRFQGRRWQIPSECLPVQLANETSREVLFKSLLSCSKTSRDAFSEADKIHRSVGANVPGSAE